MYKEICIYTHKCAYIQIHFYIRPGNWEKHWVGEEEHQGPVSLDIGHKSACRNAEACAEARSSHPWL